MSPEECHSCSLQTEFPIWRLGDADRAQKFSGHVLQNEDCMCVSIYINTKHLNDDYTSGYDVYGGAAWGHHTRVTHYSSSLVFYTSSFLFPWDCSHLFPSKTYALPSHGGIRLSSLRFTRSDYPPLSRGLLLRASSSQNGPPALWWKANRLPRGSGSLDRYMLIAA